MSVPSEEIYAHNKSQHLIFSLHICTQHSVIFSARYANICCQRILSHEVKNPTQYYFPLNTQFSEIVLLICSTPRAKIKAQGDVQSVSLISESNIRTSQLVYYSKRQLQ